MTKSSNFRINTSIGRRLLSRGISGGRIAGFVLSNFIGLLMVCAALQIYRDVRPLAQEEGSFVSTDYVVVNKQVGSVGDAADRRFTPAEIADLEAQPWVRSVGRFTAASYRVDGSVETGAHGMRTALFFESIPDSYVDAPAAHWSWRPGDTEVPIIIPRDYLALYNFGFAASAGLPQLTEGAISGIPLDLRLGDGERTLALTGRVVGYSTRLNTILVPQSFMEASNALVGEGETPAPSRLIIDVSRPGDTAIAEYLQAHGLERAGDGDDASATFLLRIAAGIVAGVGLLVTVLSFFLLLLSVSLIMERNRARIHLLLTLGYPLREAAAPYIRMVCGGCAVACGVTCVALWGLRGAYAEALCSLGGGDTGVWLGMAAAVVLTLLSVTGNVISIRRRVAEAWRGKGLKESA